MATIVLQGEQPKSGATAPDGKHNTRFAQTTAVVASSPGRVHYARQGGFNRTYERVGIDASGNEIYRDQTRY